MEYIDPSLSPEMYKLKQENEWLWRENHRLNQELSGRAFRIKHHNLVNDQPIPERSSRKVYGGLLEDERVNWERLKNMPGVELKEDISWYQQFLKEEVLKEPYRLNSGELVYMYQLVELTEHQVATQFKLREQEQINISHVLHSRGLTFCLQLEDIYKHSYFPYFATRTIHSLPFTQRVKNIVAYPRVREKIETIGELALHDQYDLSIFNNCGPKAIAEMTDMLQLFGFGFGMTAKRLEKLYHS